MNNISRKDRIVGALFALFGGVLWGMSGCIGEFLFTRKAVSSLLLGADFTVWDGVGFVCVFVMLVLLSLRKD